jgi:hypothetical protein
LPKFSIAYRHIAFSAIQEVEKSHDKDGCPVKKSKRPFYKDLDPSLPLPFLLNQNLPMTDTQGPFKTLGEGMPHGLEDGIGLYIRLCR